MLRVILNDGRKLLYIVDAESIADPEIREVYCSDIIGMSRRVQSKFGLMAFLFPEGDPAGVTGFYEFRVWSIDKNNISNGRKL